MGSFLTIVSSAGTIAAGQESVNLLVLLNNSGYRETRTTPHEAHIDLVVTCNDYDTTREAATLVLHEEQVEVTLGVFAHTAHGLWEDLPDADYASHDCESDSASYMPNALVVSGPTNSGSRGESLTLHSSRLSQPSFFSRFFRAFFSFECFPHHHTR